MPFLGPEASTSVSWNGIVDAGTHATFTASTDALPGAATWPPSAASLSTAQSHMDSSAPVGITEINLVSSPPTSHATSPLRPSARTNIPSPSELRAGSKAAISTATAARLEGAFVANSDPEDGGEIEADGADTPRDRSRSPEQGDVPESTVYVQLPASSPSMAVHSGSASRRKSKGASGSDSPKRRRRGSKSSETSQPGASSVVDDAALAAQLAAQEAALARRRPTRGSRKDVSYSPVCDLDGKPLRKKQAAAAAPASSSASTSKDKSKKTTPTRKVSGKRRSRVFSDDEDEDEHADAGSSSAAPAEALTAEKEGGGEEQHDADLTDEDVGFQARDRKKPRKSKPGRAEETQEPDVARAEASTPGNKGKARRRHDEEEEMHSDASGGDGDDGILTPPAPTSPRRKSGKRNASPEVQAAEPDTNSAASGVQMAKTQSGDEDEQEKGDSAASPRSSAASAEAAASGRKTPATVAIKRVGTTSSPSASPSTRSFFGKPLTSLLTGTVRRPGLTRKTNIPSLLAHRTAPKPPAPKLAVSKRRMQDDDYEYDAAYEALIAKPEPDSSDSDEPAPNQVEYEEEYD